MHAAPLPFGDADSAAGEFAHDLFAAKAADQGQGVAAVAGDEIIAVFAGGLQACGDGFLADIEVAEALDFLLLVERGGLFFKPAHIQHGFVPMLRIGHTPAQYFVREGRFGGVFLRLGVGIGCHPERGKILGFRAVLRGLGRHVGALRAWVWVTPRT